MNIVILRKIKLSTFEGLSQIWWNMTYVHTADLSNFWLWCQTGGTANKVIIPLFRACKLIKDFNSFSLLSLSA